MLRKIEELRKKHLGMVKNLPFSKECETLIYHFIACSHEGAIGLSSFRDWVPHTPAPIEQGATPPWYVTPELARKFCLGIAESPRPGTAPKTHARGLSVLGVCNGVVYHDKGTLAPNLPESDPDCITHENWKKVKAPEAKHEAGQKARAEGEARRAAAGDMSEQSYPTVYPRGVAVPQHVSAAGNTTAGVHAPGTPVVEGNAQPAAGSCVTAPAAVGSAPAPSGPQAPTPEVAMAAEDEGIEAPKEFVVYARVYGGWD